MLQCTIILISSQQFFTILSLRKQPTVTGSHNHFISSLRRWGCDAVLVGDLLTWGLGKCARYLPQIQSAMETILRAQGIPVHDLPRRASPPFAPLPQPHFREIGIVAGHGEGGKGGKKACTNCSTILGHDYKWYLLTPKSWSSRVIVHVVQPFFSSFSMPGDNLNFSEVKKG